MRLINATSLVIHEFLDEARIPPFAILSHTWEEEECTLQQMQDPIVSQVSQRKGYLKIELCCIQALRDGYEWAWIDTCCIDKTSTAELSEAINSMFRWYRGAQACYAYLTDVMEVGELNRSRWFTRGWTLQELVAPSTVRFYSTKWEYLGSKHDLLSRIHEITGIEAEALTAGTLETFSIARRMSWAAKRQTTRIEDQAYSLMGIFDVNMPLLYGEGSKAFKRLQEEILKVSDDQSLFAWGLPAEVKTMQQFVKDFRYQTETPMREIFAALPSEFTHSELIHILEDEQSALPPIVSSNGVRIELQLKKIPYVAVQFAVIYCTLRDRYSHYIAFPVMPWGRRWVARCGELVTVAVEDLVAADSARPFSKPSVLFIKSPERISRELNVRNTVKLIEMPNRHKAHYTLDDVHCAEHASYSPKDQTLTVSGNQDTLHAVYFYAPAVSDLIYLFSFERSGRHGLLKSDMSLTMRKSRPTNTHIFTKKEWSMAHMPFAILVGGRLEDPWLRIMVITSEDMSWTDLDILLESDKDFKSCCTTKSSLLSLLNRSNKVGLPKSNVTPHARQITMRSTYKDGFGTNKTVSAQLGVSAQLRVVASSLIETSLTLLVAIDNFGDRRFEKQVQWPGWWAKLVDTAQEE